jgi:ubiquinone/menaquinone biosynthesis C-methylase UbiE
MSSPPFKDHFSAASENYAAYRPTYPRQLIDELANICPGLSLALDCGCGSGQLSVLLKDRFDRVVATDASAAQIEMAQHREGVTYRVALAEDCGLPDHSADLITVAQAAHWLDLDSFYNEARRVARPNAVIALVTYGVLHLEGPLDAIVQRFYHQTIGPYWPTERRHVEDGYRNLPFPFEENQLPAMNMEASWTLEDLLGYVSTWSAVKVAEKTLRFSPVTALEEELRTLWGDLETRRLVTWPLSTRVGTVPSER